MDKAKEIFGFIRINICLYVTSLAAIGYLLYSKPDLTFMYVALSAFFGCAAAYAYNNITDIKEDAINRKRLNYFSEKPSGNIIVALCTLIGLYFALQLPAASGITYLSSVMVLIAYSAFRIKKYFLIKNIWTALGISQSFLIGTSASITGASIAAVYVPVLLLAFIGSIIADMKDVEGDKKTGVITLPLKIGIAHTKHMIYVTASIVILLLSLADMRAMYVSIVSTPVVGLLVSKDKFAEAHAMGGLSFILLLAYLFASWMF